MRIIAGSARGRRLESPEGRTARPTLDRVRENLFNILMPRLENALFLDLFAGTGAVGLEALSRGAARAVFVEAEDPMLAVLRRNTALCGFEDRAAAYRMRLPGGMDVLGGPFDLVFADPPWDFDGYGELLEALSPAGLVAEKGWVVLESSAKTPPTETAGRWTSFRHKQYGETLLTFYA